MCPARDPDHVWVWAEDEELKVQKKRELTVLRTRLERWLSEPRRTDLAKLIELAWELGQGITEERMEGAIDTCYYEMGYQDGLEERMDDPERASSTRSDTSGTREDPSSDFDWSL
jgi:hypothetical protein